MKKASKNNLTGHHPTPLSRIRGVVSQTHQESISNLFVFSQEIRSSFKASMGPRGSCIKKEELLPSGNRDRFSFHDIHTHTHTYMFTVHISKCY